jgi:hypothetical protein
MKFSNVVCLTELRLIHPYKDDKLLSQTPVYRKCTILARFMIAQGGN